MSNEKGGLIKKKKKPIMQAPAPVIKTQDADFSYSTAPAPVEKEVKQPVKKHTERKRSQTIGKKNSMKTLKVPSDVHTQVNLLGSFMDESKTYVILQRLINSYVTNELTNRQQRQFEFMFEASKEEN